MGALRVLMIGAALSLAASTALGADDPPKPLRLFGESASAKDPAPQHFILDAVAKPGDGEFQTTLEGWLAGLDGQTPLSGSVEGSCVEKHCALTVSIDDGKYALTGDFAEATGPVAVRFQIKDDDGKLVQQG